MHGAPPEYGRPRAQHSPPPPQDMRIGGQARAVPSSEGFNPRGDPDRLEGGVCPTCGARGEEEKDRQNSPPLGGANENARQPGGLSVGDPARGGAREDDRQKLGLVRFDQDWSKEGEEKADAEAVGRMLVWMWRGAVAVVLALVGLHFARMDLDTLALLLDSRLQVLPGMLHPAPCTLHPAPGTLHPAPCTLHPAPCTLRPTPCT